MRLLGIFIFLIYLTCSAQNNDEKDTYSILSLISNRLTNINKNTPYPPIPINQNVKIELDNPISQQEQDSILIEKGHKRTLENQTIIAIDTILYPYFGNPRLNPPEECSEFKTLFEKFIFNKNQTVINPKNIKLERNDSLISFKNEYNNPHRKDYDSIDVRLAFSNVVFAHNRAIVQVNYNTSKLAGISLIYFLKKTKGKWQIICEKGISIS